MKILLTLTAAAFFIGIFAENIHTPQPSEKDAIPSADSIIAYAQKFVGVPYKWSGRSPQGFDCSGFVSYVYEHYKIDLPRSSVDYQGIGIPVHADSCRKGDIILFCGRDNNLSKVGHVGIIITNAGESLKFIHSSSSQKHWGVTISDFKGTGYVNRFIGIRRLNEMITTDSL
jgi:cell wall-associated NlpC family hydrolase